MICQAYAHKRSSFTLTIQDAYDGGNESSELVSTIIFEDL
jgi:hypothetical protein